MNLQEIKKLTAQYLERCGKDIFRDGKSMKIHCLTHSEKNPSAQINKNGQIHCHGCGSSVDIFDAVLYIEGISGFRNQLKRIENLFGIELDKNDVYQNREPVAKPVYRGHRKHTDFIPLPLDLARQAYNKKRAREILAYSKIEGEIIDIYPFLSESGMVNCADFRIEKQDGKKQVITFWFDGQSLKISNPPNLIWGLDHIDSEKPCLIVEGAKCAKIANDNLSDYFSVHTWNRGCEGAKYCDWNSIGNNYSQYYLFYDYDQKLDNNGKLLDIKNQPGYKAMYFIADTILEHNERPECACFLVPPSKEAIVLKPDGADIVEQLEVFSPQECYEYIMLSCGDNYDNDTSVPF